mmetsp:Transcript_18157/g.27471  ORF Transcript_18157/g.27471 Transcript_18157/m.27471 type:complete len:85 (+) Transcript_18157:540-794(+)
MPPTYWNNFPVEPFISKCDSRGGITVEPLSFTTPPEAATEDIRQMLKARSLRKMRTQAGLFVHTSLLFLANQHWVICIEGWLKA